MAKAKPEPEGPMVKVQVFNTKGKEIFTTTEPYSETLMDKVTSKEKAGYWHVLLPPDQ